MSLPEVAIVILNWNQAEETVECLTSVKSLAYSNYRVVVVDNGSRDGSPVRILEQCPWVELIRNKRNVGFAEGCNTALRKLLESQTPYFLFLNNDAKIDSRCLTLLVDEMERKPEVGIVGAVNYSLTKPDLPWTCGHRFIWWSGTLERLLPPKEWKEPLFNIQSVSGSCFLVRRELFKKIGLFDERFFIYYEETDFCLKAKRAGFGVMVHREASVWHEGSHTFGRRSAVEYYLFTRNHALCLMRHCPKGFLPSASVIYGLKTFLRCLLLIGRGQFREASAVSAGVWDACVGRFGEGRLAAFSQKGIGASDG